MVKATKHSKHDEMRTISIGDLVEYPKSEVVLLVTDIDNVAGTLTGIVLYSSDNNIGHVWSHCKLSSLEKFHGTITLSQE
jgi:carbon monoxide dehydrogenase subunit G